MRFSQLLGKTLRQVGAEADTQSHQLMLRAGLIYQVAAGVYSYLPTGWRALRKLETVIREEMNATGAQELVMPVLQPCEMWEQSGRRKPFGQTLFTLKDRRERELCLGPTHEEIVTDIVAHQVKSYRDLPLSLYQIQVKFRDEARPRGGLLRVREFHMKDCYSFHADEASLDEGYRAVCAAYQLVSSKIDPNDATKAQASIDRVLANVNALQSKAAALKQKTETGMTAWQAREADFDRAGDQIVEMSDGGYEKANAFRAVHDAILTKAKDRNYRQAYRCASSQSGGDRRLCQCFPRSRLDHLLSHSGHRPPCSSEGAGSGSCGHSRDPSKCSSRRSKGLRS